jgi:hypothetical protein
LADVVQPVNTIENKTDVIVYESVHFMPIWQWIGSLKSVHIQKSDLFCFRLSKNLSEKKEMCLIRTKESEPIHCQIGRHKVAPFANLHFQMIKRIRNSDVHRVFSQKIL